MSATRIIQRRNLRRSGSFCVADNFIQRPSAFFIFNTETAGGANRMALVGREQGGRRRAAVICCHRYHTWELNAIVAACQEKTLPILTKRD